MADYAGLKLITPASVSATGGSASASIGATGIITFTTVETLQVNSCFSSSYHHYLLKMRYSVSAGQFTRIQMRAGGSNSATTYSLQYANLNNTSLSAGRGSSLTYWDAMYAQTTYPNAYTLYFFSPAEAIYSSYRLVDNDSEGGARIYETAGVHATSSAYDGLNFSRVSGNMTGTLAVYAWNE